ncbi:MAG: hypothetical protein NZ920_01660 [Aigarchaeota archaeon]|nr:hypothetical protein [Aigarchaeota archaeon]MDW8093149.1 hypothetical protein [Nitrososphaerota archaeon]
MSSTIIATSVFISLAVLGGVILAPSVPDTGGGFQWALLVQFYAALTSIITPISSVFNDGLTIHGPNNVTISSSYGLWPIAILVIASALAVLIASAGDRYEGSGFLATFTGSLALIGGWIVLGFIAIPVFLAGTEWTNQLNQIFNNAIYSRPLELPMIVMISLSVSALLSIVINAVRGDREELYERSLLFPWREWKKRR